MPGWLSVVLITVVLLVLYQIAEMIRKGWPENKKEKVTFLLVIKNQEKTIEGIIRGLMKMQGSNYPDYEIVVVDKGSKDDSLPILYKLSKEYPSLIVVTTYYRFTKESILMVIKDRCHGNIVYYFNLIDEIRPTQIIKTMNSLLQGDCQQYNTLLKKMDFYTITRKIYANN